jgi:mono/diheme cytochrome c family protein
VKACLKIGVVGCLAVLLSVPALAQDSGEATYKLKCAMCHGDDGMANTPAGKAFKAASFHDPAVVKTADADLIAIVKSGKNGKMPAFGDKLNEDQIKSVVGYIRTMEKQEPTTN